MVVKEWKQMILKFLCGDEVTDVSLFITKDNVRSTKLNSNMNVGQLLSNGQTDIYVKDKCFNECWPVWQADKEIGKVYGDASQDTVRTIKLRVQDQLAIPAGIVQV